MSAWRDMPGDIDGIELARLAVSTRPRIAVVLTSGFPETKINGDSDMARSTSLLGKPYRMEELARALHDALDRKKG
jgi:DNA-binding NarL/FixJ family response regulator